MAVTINGTSGLTFPDATTQTTAAGGAPASMNEIGSYIIAVHTGLDLNTPTASVGPDTTVAGSVLQRASDQTNAYGLNMMNSSTPYFYSTATSYTSLGLSGTWRLLSQARSQTSGALGSTARPLFFAVRIS